MTIKIYNVKNYNTANNLFINKEAEQFNDIEDLVKQLKFNQHYHFRVHKDTNYIFFGDLDKYTGDFEDFAETLKIFLANEYQINIDLDDIKYTVNKNNTGSYHYSIPKLYGKTEILKYIHQQFNKKHCKNIDTTIYSEHWYRCPNQYKGNDQSLDNIHLIEQGDLLDFIIENIPENSLDLNKMVKIEKQTLALKPRT